MDTWTHGARTHHQSQLVIQSPPPGYCRRVDFEGKIMGGCQGAHRDSWLAKTRLVSRIYLNVLQLDVTFSWNCHVRWTKKNVFMGCVIAIMVSWQGRWQTIVLGHPTTSWSLVFLHPQNIPKNTEPQEVFECIGSVWQALALVRFFGSLLTTFTTAFGNALRAFHGCTGHRSLSCQDVDLPGLQVGICESVECVCGFFSLTWDITWYHLATDSKRNMMFFLDTTLNFLDFMVTTYGLWGAFSRNGCNVRCSKSSNIPSPKII